jgi:hypothetical protein
MNQNRKANKNARVEKVGIEEPLLSSAEPAGHNL